MALSPIHITSKWTLGLPPLVSEDAVRWEPYYTYDGPAPRSVLHANTFPDAFSHYGEYH